MYQTNSTNDTSVVNEKVVDNDTHAVIKVPLLPKTFSITVRVFTVNMCRKRSNVSSNITVTVKLQQVERRKLTVLYRLVLWYC